MATNNTEIIIKLQNSEKVKCSECGIGHYIPYGKITDIKKCYHFRCENCGNMIIATKRMPLYD